MLISTLLSAAMAMQATPSDPISGPRVVAPDNPETWVTEYPIIIRPLVQDYRRCLNYADRRFRGLADFEQQHSEDLPRCEKLKTKLVRKSEKALSQGRWSEFLEPSRAHQVFETVALVHISRGRDFDNQLKFMRQQQLSRRVNTDIGPDAQNN